MSLPNATATIIAGSSSSGVVPMLGKLSGISIPTSWNGPTMGAYAPIWFMTSPDNGASWYQFTQNGNVLILPVPSGLTFLGIDYRFWGGVTALIVNSGAPGSPVNQTAQAPLTLTQQA